MSIANGIKKLCEKVGKDNNPAYVVVCVAVAKGIFRPLFTMMDKKESPETKKYAALREGLTEVVAIPTYIACGALAGAGSKLIKDPDKALKAKHNLRFIGVCTAALLVIPGLCSVFVKPFTEKIFNKNAKKDTNNKLDITSVAIEPVKIKNNSPNQEITKPTNLPQVHTITIANFTNNIGMKVS